MDYIKLRELLEKHEGYRNMPYVDSVGKTTIGIGHNLTDLGLSDDVIERQYSIDVGNAIDDCTKLINDFFGHPELVQVVICNMMFNLGYNRLKKFHKFIAALERHDYRLASIEMLDSKWADQVGNRAIELSEIMVSYDKYSKTTG